MHRLWPASLADQKRQPLYGRIGGVMSSHIEGRGVSFHLARYNMREGDKITS
ncbi:hypothetical protein [Motiliproteus sp. MSK22-1]|uniref:hypothetical protein n=1 Tax=Motiliproteus sp. MSK22-1 TaxID=1897630 RepID=UPI001300E630|nr:hypothetical protein [Motiliproteus sp. MSK22-1]